MFYFLPPCPETGTTVLDYVLHSCLSTITVHRLHSQPCHETVTEILALEELSQQGQFMSYTVSLVTNTVATILVQVLDSQPCHETGATIFSSCAILLGLSQNCHGNLSSCFTFVTLSETSTTALVHVLHSYPLGLVIKL